MKKYSKNILFRFMTLILIFMSIMLKKIQFDENGWKYILFRTDVYFTGHFVAVEISGKGHTCRDHTFEEKKQEALDKNLIVNLLQLL